MFFGVEYSYIRLNFKDPKILTVSPNLGIIIHQQTNFAIGKGLRPVWPFGNNTLYGDELFFKVLQIVFCPATNQ